MSHAAIGIRQQHLVVILQEMFWPIPAPVQGEVEYVIRMCTALGVTQETLKVRPASLGAPPPAGSLVHALLVTPLNSATTQKGAEVTAVLSQPLFDGERLILPEGTRLKGDVVQVRPAGGGTTMAS